MSAVTHVEHANRVEFTARATSVSWGIEMSDGNSHGDDPRRTAYLNGPCASRHTLPPATGNAIRRISYTRSWQEGEAVLVQGKVAESLLLVEEGRLRLSTMTWDGEEFLFGWISPGEQLGLCSVLTGLASPFTATAMERCRTRHVDNVALRELMQTNPHVAVEIAELLARRLNESMARVQMQGQESLAAQAYETLRRLAKFELAREDDPEPELRISQADLACMLGSSRQHLNAQLRILEERGLIRRGYRSIVLLSARASTTRF